MVEPQARKRFRRLVQVLTASIRLLHIFKARGLTFHRKKKALIIGINYDHNKVWKLRGPQADATKAKNLLTDTFNFLCADITLLSDSRDASPPTQASILEALHNFVVKGEPNVDYVFIYSGHSDQFPAADKEKSKGEEDNLSECIIPSDAITPEQDDIIVDKVIFDYDLKELLVKRLGKGSQLVAIFDSCHSATLLIRQAGRRFICDPFGLSVVRVQVDSEQSANRWVQLHGFPYRVRRSGTQTSTESQESSSEGMCTGLCANPQVFDSPRVFCISACKDKEVIWENGTGESMLHAILGLLKVNPQPTFRQLMDATRGTAKIICDGAKEWHTKQEVSKMKDCFLIKRLIRRVTARKEIKRWNPEISAPRPLNMDAKFILCTAPPYAQIQFLSPPKLRPTIQQPHPISCQLNDNPFLSSISYRIDLLEIPTSKYFEI